MAIADLETAQWINTSCLMPKKFIQKNLPNLASTTKMAAGYDPIQRCQQWKRRVDREDADFHESEYITARPSIGMTKLPCRSELLDSVPMGLKVAWVAQELAVCQNAFSIPSLSRALTTRVEQTCGTSDFVWISFAKRTLRDIQRLVKVSDRQIHPATSSTCSAGNCDNYCGLIDWINHTLWSDLKVFLPFTGPGCSRSCGIQQCTLQARHSGQYTALWDLFCHVIGASMVQSPKKAIDDPAMCCWLWIQKWFKQGRSRLGQYAVCMLEY